MLKSCVCAPRELAGHEPNAIDMATESDSDLAGALEEEFREAQESPDRTGHPSQEEEESEVDPPYDRPIPAAVASDGRLFGLGPGALDALMVVSDDDQTAAMVGACRPDEPRLMLGGEDVDLVVMRMS